MAIVHTEGESNTSAARRAWAEKHPDADTRALLARDADAFLISEPGDGEEPVVFGSSVIESDGEPLRVPVGPETRAAREACATGIYPGHLAMRIVDLGDPAVTGTVADNRISNTIRAAMAGWAKTLSSELPAGITINNVLPGFTATERLSSLASQTAARTGSSQDSVLENWRSTIPEGRLGEAHEIAALIAFLVSPAASYVRGQSIAADGGRLLSI